MQVLGINNAEIVTDNGYYSEKNLAELLHARFDFITLINWLHNSVCQKPYRGWI